MFKNMKKVLILFTVLFTLTGCGVSHDSRTAITIKEDMSGSLSMMMYLSQSSLDSKVSSEDVRTLVDSVIADNTHLANTVSIEVTDYSVELSYEESFTSLEELEKIMERISGEPVTLELVEEDSDLTPTSEIKGFPDDDNFFVDWIYDIIEQKQLFSDDSNDIRDNAYNYYTINWNGKDYYGSEIVADNAPVLNSLESHSTFYRDGDSSYNVTLDFKDESLIEPYVKLLTKDLDVSYSKSYKKSVKDSVLSIEFKKDDWSSFRSEYLYGIINDYEIEKYVDYAEYIYSDDLLESNNIDKDPKEVKVYLISSLTPDFNIEKASNIINTVKFVGFDVLNAHEYYDEEETLRVVDDSFEITKDIYAVGVLVSENNKSLGGSSIPWLPIIGGIAIGVAIVGVVVVVFSKKKKEEEL